MDLLKCGNSIFHNRKRKLDEDSSMEGIIDNSFDFHCFCRILAARKQVIDSFLPNPASMTISVKIIQFLKDAKDLNYFMQCLIMLHDDIACPENKAVRSVIILEQLIQNQIFDDNLEAIAFVLKDVQAIPFSLVKFAISEKKKLFLGIVTEFFPSVLRFITQVPTRRPDPNDLWESWDQHFQEQQQRETKGSLESLLIACNFETQQIGKNPFLNLKLAWDPCLLRNMLLYGSSAGVHFLVKYMSPNKAARSTFLMEVFLFLAESPVEMHVSLARSFAYLLYNGFALSSSLYNALAIIDFGALPSVLRYAFSSDWKQVLKIVPEMIVSTKHHAHVVQLVAMGYRFQEAELLSFIEFHEENYALVHDILLIDHELCRQVVSTKWVNMVLRTFYGGRRRHTSRLREFLVFLLEKGAVPSMATLMQFRREVEDMMFLYQDLVTLVENNLKCNLSEYYQYL